MSTIPELLAATQIDMRCIVFSMVTNLAAGLQDVLSDQDIFQVALERGKILGKLIENLIGQVEIYDQFKLDVNELAPLAISELDNVDIDNDSNRLNLKKLKNSLKIIEKTYGEFEN